jgi:hypothetical protein
VIREIHDDRASLSAAPKRVETHFVLAEVDLVGAFPDFCKSTISVENSV